MTGRVVVVATGGTIGSVPTPDGVTIGAPLSSLLPDHPDLGRVEVIEDEPGHSWNFDADRMWAIARRAATLARGDDVAGVVVTHGTDGIELTALLCDLTLGSAGAVVVTGAMRNAAEVGFDGPRNVLDSVRVARDGVLRGGMVAFAGDIHAARWVTKGHTTGLSPFVSPGRGPIGSVGDHGVHADRPNPLPPPVPPAEPDRLVPVAVVPVWAGLDPGIIDWHVDRGARGIVLDTTGAGNVAASLVPGIERALDTGAVVVVASRCAAGPVQPVYGGDGGGAWLASVGAISAGDLTAYKARLALMVAMSRDADPAAVAGFFAHLTGEATAGG